MELYEQKLLDYIKSHRIQAELLSFNQSCHSVAEAAQAVGTSPENLVKNICLIDGDAQLIVAIVKGEDRVDPGQVGIALEIEVPRVATPAEILEKTGFPCGGVPSFGYPACFLIDPRVMEKETVYTGGGSPNALVKIATVELVKANQGQIVKIHK
ncbi:MAG: aminoacyl-tRNA deacylase [Bacteroidota bacterium]